jgi:hypothetical protein
VPDTGPDTDDAARSDAHAVELDRSLLMNLGSLATIGLLQASNLMLVVDGQRSVRHDGGQQTPKVGGEEELKRAVTQTDGPCDDSRRFRR